MGAVGVGEWEASALSGIGVESAGAAVWGEVVWSEALSHGVPTGGRAQAGPAFAWLACHGLVLGRGRVMDHSSETWASGLSQTGSA